MDWAAWWALGAYFATLAVPIVMLFVVPHRRRPSSAIAWLLVIALVPWIGLVLFLLLGHPRLPRQRRRRLQEMRTRMQADIEAARADPDAPWLAVSLSEDHAQIAQMAARLGALPPFRGNHVEALDDYEGTLRAMEEDIDAAQRYVHVQSYIFALDETTEPLVEALERAARRGVHVRVLLDHLGSHAFARHRELMRRLRRAGDVALMLPFRPWRGRFSRPDLRNHRKTLVVDGDVGYIGSMNLIDRSYRKAPEDRKRFRYLEVVARTRGPIVQQIDAVFRGDWYAETGTHVPDHAVPQVLAGETLAQVLPSGPGHAAQANLRVFNALVHGASRRIVITNAYFVPDETLMMALTSAAQRGVEVVLVTPAKGNQWLLRLVQRSYYEDLLRAGVRVFLHPRPWNLHTKTMSIDGDACVIGSSNLDIRSFELNLEVSLICYDDAVVSRLADVEAGYLADCTELTLEEWLATPVSVRAVQNVARLTSALQ